MLKGTVYIAGPMTNIPEFNFPAFDEAADKWRAKGYTVISPAEHDRDEGLDVTGMTGSFAEAAAAGFDLTATLLWDLNQVAHADGIILLPGWGNSSGVRAELSLAAALGKWAIEDAYGAEAVPAKSLFVDRPVEHSAETRINA